jgi:hypothetical protein
MNSDTRFVVWIGIIVGLVFYAVSVMFGQAAATPDPKALQVQALNAEANARECQAQLLRVQARMTDGSLSDRAAFVKELEDANPTLVFDAHLKANPKPAEKTVK